MAHFPQQSEDFTSAMNGFPSGSDDESDTGSESSENECEELRRVCAVAAPRAANASPDEVRTVSILVSAYKFFIYILCIDQALEEAQNLLLVMRGKFQVLEKRNTLLEAQKGKGRRSKKVGNLSNKELSVALKNDVIHVYGRKYSATHCIWVPVEIFPLRQNPEVDLFSAEWWLSPLVIEDGVKTELFKFIAKDDHSLMHHKDFAKLVSHLSYSLLPSKLNFDIISLYMAFKPFVQK